MKCRGVDYKEGPSGNSVKTKLCVVFCNNGVLVFKRRPTCTFSNLLTRHHGRQRAKLLAWVLDGAIDCCMRFAFLCLVKSFPFHQFTEAVVHSERHPSSCPNQ